MLGRDDNALLAQLFDLVRKMLEIEHHAGTKHVHRAGAQNARRQQIENELAPGVHDGVTGVVSALIADDDLVIGGKEIDHAALSLVAPVDSDNSSKHFYFLLKPGWRRSRRCRRGGRSKRA